MSQSSTRVFLSSVQLLLQLSPQHSHHLVPVLLTVSRSCQAFDCGTHKQKFGGIPNSIHDIVPVVVELVRNRRVLQQPDKGFSVIFNEHEANSSSFAHVSK